MMDDEIYKENILDHYKHPRNKGELSPCDVCRRELNPLCGDEISIYLNFKDDKVADVKFNGNGCAISLASVSMLTERLKGMTKEDIQKLKDEDILNMLGISISQVRMKCALLSLKTVQKGIEEC